MSSLPPNIFYNLLCFPSSNQYQRCSVERREHAGQRQAGEEAPREEHRYDYFTDWWNAKFWWACRVWTYCGIYCIFVLSALLLCFIFGITFLHVVPVRLKESPDPRGSRRMCVLLLEETCLCSVLDSEMMWITPSWMWWANKTKEWPAEFMRVQMQHFNFRWRV